MTSPKYGGFCDEISVHKNEGITWPYSDEDRANSIQAVLRNSVGAMGRGIIRPLLVNNQCLSIIPLIISGNIQVQSIAGELK